MNNLPDIKKVTGLAITSSLQNKSLDVRREMANIPQVMQALSPVEKAMFLASTKTPISEIEQEILVEQTGNLAKFISRDAGIKQIDEYDAARFMDIIQKYYSSLSLAEIKLAFEFSMTGELDDYLPKDKNGNPDKNHYQAFSVEYVTKIINAYRKRKRDTEHKAYTAIPQKQKQLTPGEIEYYNRWARNTLIQTYLEYKYLGRINSETLNEFILYRELEAIGMAEPVIVTEADKRNAVSRLLKKSQMGLINSFVADCIRRLQTRHSDVAGEAFMIAKKRAVIQSLDSIIKDEIQLIDLLIKN